MIFRPGVVGFWVPRRDLEMVLDSAGMFGTRELDLRTIWRLAWSQIFGLFNIFCMKGIVNRGVLTHVG